MLQATNVMSKAKQSKDNEPKEVESTTIKCKKPSKAVAKRLSKEKKLVNPINIVKPNIIFTNPTTEIDFSHDFITDDLNRFNIEIGRCQSCCPAIKHFMDSKAATERLIQKNIVFVPNSKAIFKDPQPNIKMELFDPSQIGR